MPSSTINATQLRDYLNLDTCNKRSLQIVKNDEEIINISLNINNGLPLINIPKRTFDAAKIRDFPFDDINTTLGTIQFNEFLTFNDQYKIHQPEVEKGTIEAYKNNIAGRFVIKSATSRFKPLLSFTSPVNALTWTFIADFLFGDIIVVPGLNYILDPDVFVPTVEGKVILQNAFAIGGHRVSFRREYIDLSLFEKVPYVQNSLLTMKANIDFSSSARAYYIPANREVLSTFSTNILPLIYDKQFQENREIQYAKYPALVIELGTAGDFYEGEEDNFHHYVLTSNSSNSMELMYNGIKPSKTGKFGIVLPIL